ncbi:MAG: CPBP family intramembrane glutamic endopeptidase [Pyrinomonadaceae bacterium]
MRTVITRNPLISFVVIAYGWTWIFAALIDQSILFPLLALFGPAVAAIIVHTAMRQTSVAVELKNRLRVSPRLLAWCILAVLLPFALLFPVWLLHTWWWGAIDFKLNQLSLLSIVVAVLIVGEELGWRGFLLPYLLQRYSPVTSSLIVGIIWAVWHLPNFLIPSFPHYGLPFSAFVLMTIAFSMLFTWFHLRTNGSLVVAVIFHAALNLFSLAGVEPSREYWLRAVIYSVIALIVYGVTSPSSIARGSLVKEVYL